MSEPPGAPADLPLLDHRSYGATLAYRGERAISVAGFMADVEATAAKLRPAQWVMNVCGDRYRFAVGLAAALLRGQITLLPPSIAPELLKSLRAEYAQCAALVDRADDAHGLAEVVGVVDTGRQGISQGDADAERLVEVPRVPVDRVAVVAFTSGSTGRPLPQAKTWGSLVQGAREEALGLGLPLDAPVVLVGTVPAQHMYGLESSVILALCNGWAFHGGRPLFPADVAQALAQVPAPAQRVLVTTPVHLRALLREGIALPALRMVVCATAPLAPDLAGEAERTFATELREIYGFTEAGMVATRRSAHTDIWDTLPGVVVARDDTRGVFSGGHVRAPVAPTDVLEVIDSTRFRLQGRDADLVNVAGKRSSLAYLNHQLLSVPGVDDGVFFLPDEGAAGVNRPAAFFVSATLTPQGLQQALRERIDPVFLPRPLFRVPALPRSATSKIPRAALLDLLARCRAGDAPPDEHIVALAAVDSAVALGHFPGNPVIPGAMLIDHVIRAAEARVGGTVNACQVKSAKFPAPARPGERLRIRFDGDANRLQFECRVDDRVVASGLLALGSADARTA